MKNFISHFLQLCFLVIMLLSMGCGETDPLQVPTTNYTIDYGHDSAKYLNVSIARQQTEVWCWAAVIEMVSSYYGNGVAQCVTLDYWYASSCCANPNYCAVPGSDEQIQHSLLALGVTSEYIYSSLSFENSMYEIDNGRPFIMFYQGSFIGHVVVAFGYNAAKQTLFIHDPYFGSFEVPYDEAFAYGNGSAYWSKTLGNFNNFFTHTEQVKFIEAVDQL